MSEYAFTEDWDVYWADVAVNDREEWAEHVRAVEDEERDRLTRDEGERAA